MNITHGIAVIFCLFSLSVCAQEKTKDNIQSVVEQTVHKALPGTKITSVSASVIPGLLEVIAGSNVLYADPTGQYLMVGNIYDMHTATDLTAQRQREVKQSIKLNWSDLPLDTAVKYSDKGTTKLAVFFDPDCPWCKKLHEQLQLLKDVEVFAILYPIKGDHTGSHTKVVDILCSDKPKQALNSVMAGKALPVTDNATCVANIHAALDRVNDFARRHTIHGTPTLVSFDGRVRAGYLDAKALTTWLENTQEKTNKEDEK
ncbi:MAG: DsbC family protein [Gammaproteobacteria bacterium]|nr:DsbC family protein [Gammaproteobacteria bacterium]MDH5651253.1 DsbC family protein [Gammaproteobacteria bacterium]